jgi:hypothetical protein
MVIMLLFSSIVRRERDFLIEFARSLTYPNLAALPLQGDAGDYGRTWKRYLGAKPARTGEHERSIFGDVLVKQDASLSIAQEPRQCSLPLQEWRLCGASPLCSIKSKA